MSRIYTILIGVDEVITGLMTDDKRQQVILITDKNKEGKFVSHVYYFDFAAEFIVLSAQ